MPNKSVDYEYTSENRLIHPHNYMYSEFEGEDFIKKYIRNRKKKIKLFSKYQSAFDVKKKDEELCKVLNNVLTEKPLSKNLDSYLKTYYRVDFKPKQVIDSSQMFKYLIARNIKNNINKNTKNWINFFIQRFEVTKKVSDEYNVSSKRKSVGKNDAIHNYWLFSILLINSYYRLSNLKYLNTMVKLNDLICSLHMNDLISLNP
jgi:hypothetical protein